MSDLQIKRSDGAEEFEEYLSSQTTFEKPLLLPNDLDEGGALGNSVAYCQFLLTWARRATQPTIKTFLRPGEKASYAKFTERAHGLCAAYVSDRLLAHEAGAWNDDIRLSVLQSARPRIEAMSRGDFDNLGRGSEVEFIFVQDAKNQFHGSVYSKAPTPTELMDRQKHGELIRNYRELNRLLELCFEKLNVSQPLERQIKRTDYVFGSLLSEVFRNTAEHGFLDIHGGRLKLNFRCIRVATALIARESLAKKSVSSPKARQVAQRYFAWMAERRSEYAREKVKVLEMSIFDSGPGFAATIEGRDATDADQARLAVARCFRKHESAKIAPRVGEGLFKVLGLINVLGGFLRVRTSTVEVFHGALPLPDGSVEADPDTFVHGGLAPIEGSVITLGIPITY